VYSLNCCIRWHQLLALLTTASRPKSSGSLRLSVRCFVESSRVTWAWQTYMWADVHLYIDSIVLFSRNRQVNTIKSLYMKGLRNMKCNYLSLPPQVIPKENSYFWSRITTCKVPRIVKGTDHPKIGLFLHPFCSKRFFCLFVCFLLQP